MARLTGPGGADPTQLLRAAGAEFRSTGAGDVPEAWLAEVLPAGERDPRAVVVVDPPAPGAEHVDMGAWHVNARDEVHLVRSGEGVLQVVTPGGIVTVVLEPGDVMMVRGAEHRYRPASPQEWVLRWSGPPGAELEPRETGRAADPWP